jgi:cytochrome P450
LAFRVHDAKFVPIHCDALSERAEVIAAVAAAQRRGATLTQSRICLPAPPVPEHPPEGLRLLASLLSNPIEIWSQEHFEQPIVVNATAFGHRIVVNDPAAIKHVLVDNASNYVRDSLQRRILLRTTGRSLFSAEGSDWQWPRRLLAPLFTPRQLASYVPGMVGAAAAASARLASAAESSKAADVLLEMARATLDVLARTILPDILQENFTDVAVSIRDYADGAGAVSLLDLLALPPWIPGIRRLRAFRAIRSVAKRSRKIVANRRAAAGRAGITPGNDLVSLLLAARHPETGRSMEEHEIEDNISTFLGAGSDTVAGALTWSLYLLSQAPEFRDRIEQELDDVLAGRPITFELVERLPFTRAVIEEAMRLYPPAPLLSRAALLEDVLCGRRIPAGSVIIIAPWLVHRHRLLWDDPLVFDPRRFLPGQRARISRFSYLPFGAGPRICIGMNFAMQEAVILLAHLLTSLRFELAPGTSVRVFQCVTLRPEGGLAMIPERRPSAGPAD